MKRFIAAILSILVLSLVPMLALAEGFGENSVEAKDDLDNEFVIADTNLENATGTMATPDNLEDKTIFGLFDSAEADHGRVYMIEPSNFAAIDNGKTGVTYAFSGKTQTLFNEPIDKNSYYIYSYEYKNILTDESKLKSGGYFSLAPKVDTFLNEKGTDWKDYVPASADKWTKRTKVFYSGEVESFSAKINTEGSYTKSYIDNFYLVKAASITLNAKNDVSLAGSANIIDSGDVGSYVAPMGESVSFKIKTAAGETVTKVTHGETEITPINGEYKIDKVTANITVDFAFSKADFEANEEVVTDGENIYVGLGDRFASFTKALGIPKANALFFDKSGAAVTSSVALIENGGKICIKYGNEVIAEYITKVLGDIDENGELSVTDIVSLNEKVLAGEQPRAGDLDKNRKTTVTDSIALRKEVLNPKNIVSAPEKFRVLAIGNSFSIDAMEHLYKVAKAYGYAEDEIILGNLYIGGCSLETHWNNAEGNAAAYTYHKNTANEWKGTASTPLLTGLKDEDWDYISIQQVSTRSGLTDTFEPYLKNLIAYINENKTNPEARLMWHSTWAYQQDSTHSGFKNYNSDQQTMFNAILEAGEYVLGEYPEIELLLPSGTAIQNMRTAIGDHLTRDGYHLNLTYGRLTASLVWFKTITGADLSELAANDDLLSICATDIPDLAEKGVTITASELLGYCIAAAEAAVKSPMGVTNLK